VTQREVGGARLHLRPLAETDLERVGLWIADSERRPWEVVDLASATDDLRVGIGSQDEDGEFRLWAVETLSGCHVGIVSWLADWRYPGVYEISELLIAPQERGQGFGTETAMLTMNALFNTRPARKVTATVAANNDAVARTIQRCGGRREATLRRQLLLAGEELDVLIFGLLRSEWLSRITGNQHTRGSRHPQ
jgi:RimJ/RimL family protein N-acetyltransferase